MKLRSLSVILLALAWTTGMAAEEGTPAPSCPTPAISGGGSVDPAARRGKVVYLDFWASWCGPCAKSFPFLDRLHRELKEQGFEVIAINLDEERRDALSFLSKHPVDFTVTVDPKGKCPRRYRVKGMPSSFLIDRRGDIRKVHLGFKESDVPQIRAEVKALLAETWNP